MINKTNYIGRIFKNRKEFGDLEVVQEIYKGMYDNNIPFQKDERWFICRFVGTNNFIIVSLSALHHGYIKNPYLPSVYSTGKLGNLPWGLNIKGRTADPLETSIYKTWNDIIRRCYNFNEPNKIHRYGDYGVNVDREWHTYANFRRDVKRLPGFEFKANDINGYQLDKDFIQRKLGLHMRVYSKNTCIWVSKTDNQMISGTENKSTRLYGVRHGRNGYYCAVEKVLYGKFNDPVAAANLFNYIYPLIMAKDPINRHIRFFNDDIPYIGFYDLSKYQTGDIDYIKSVQRREQETGLKVDVSVPGIIHW